MAVPPTGVECDEFLGHTCFKLYFPLPINTFTDDFASDKPIYNLIS